MSHQDPEDDQGHFKKIDPHLREEVGGILERAFRLEGGRPAFQLEEDTLKTLVQEGQEKAEKARSLAEEAERAARQASERYAESHSLEDLDTLQRWEAEAASYYRDAERFQADVERLSSIFSG